MMLIGQQFTVVEVQRVSLYTKPAAREPKAAAHSLTLSNTGGRRSSPWVLGPTSFDRCRTSGSMLPVGQSVESWPTSAEAAHNGNPLRWACISLRTDACVSASRVARNCRRLCAWILCVAFSNSENGAKYGSFK